MSYLVVALLSIAVVAGLGVPGAMVMSAPAVQSDLDAFMQKVVARRDENWKRLQQYVLDERELIEVRGPSKIPVWGTKREYSWYIRDGFFVRSPTKADGVAIGDDERRKYEEDFFKRAQAREKKPAEGSSEPEVSTAEPLADVEGLLKQSRRPEFIDSAYFLRFKFEQGKYAFVGRESFEGNDVLRVEYYPARLFTHEQDKEKKKQADGKRSRGDAMEAAMERMMNKVSLVTLWIEPTSLQIVKYTFDNVNFDFLPAAWLVRVSDLKATMTMSRPFKDIKDQDLWFPRDVEFFFEGTLAIGTFDARYHLEYFDYKQALTSGRIKKSEF